MQCSVTGGCPSNAGPSVSEALAERNRLISVVLQILQLRPLPQAKQDNVRYEASWKQAGFRGQKNRA